MKNSISQEFNLLSLIRFTTPSIVMMIFTALYGIVDGVFVSRFINTDALSAFNIVYPFINVVIGIGVMLASGGSAVIATKLGEGKTKEGRENFTLIIISGIISGIAISIIGYLFLDKIIYALGGTKDLYLYCRQYLLTTLLFAPTYIINLLYQILTITAGKPKIGLILTVIGGVSNIILDYVFIVPMDLGVVGAALATGMGNLIPTLLGTIYFMKIKETLYFVKPKFDKSVLINACSNGSSEMVTNLATGITTMLFNIVMMKYLGSDGVAAMSIVLYSQFLITAIFIGFSSGVAPIISYNYGEKNKKQLRNIIRYSLIFILTMSLVSYIVSILIAPEIVSIFSPKGSRVYQIGYNGLLLFGTSFLITGVNIFASSMFTAFSNGKVSATISFFRTFIFIVGGIAILPNLIGVDGIWISVPVAEVLTIIISITCIYKYRSDYLYGK